MNSQPQLSIRSASETCDEHGKRTFLFDCLVRGVVCLPTAKAACREARGPLRHDCRLSSKEGCLLVCLGVHVFIVIWRRLSATRSGKVDFDIKPRCVRTARLEVQAKLLEVVFDCLNECWRKIVGEATFRSA